MATDNLLPQVIKMFEELGTVCTTVSEVINSKDKTVFKAIQDGVDCYNTTDIPDWYKVNNGNFLGKLQRCFGLLCNLCKEIQA